ncbi:MAG: antitoxin [Bacteroidetes bacterium]|nr:MAG: antitoxin [Bacteroidota bacterium]
MDYKDRIISDYKIMLGKPVIKGTRITVELLLRKMAEGAIAKEILEMYPTLQLEDLKACLQYAADVIAKEEVIEIAKAS